MNKNLGNWGGLSVIVGFFIILIFKIAYDDNNRHKVPDKNAEKIYLGFIWFGISLMAVGLIILFIKMFNKMNTPPNTSSQLQS